MSERAKVVGINRFGIDIYDPRKVRDGAAPISEFRINLCSLVISSRKFGTQFDGPCEIRDSTLVVFEITACDSSGVESFRILGLHTNYFGEVRDRLCIE